MHRTLLAILVVAACAEQPLPPTALPELAVPTPATAAVDRALDLRPGEQLTWQLRWRGVPAGRMVVETSAAPAPSGPGRRVTVASRLRTEGVAARLVTLDHRLVSAIDTAGRRPIESRELYDDGEGSRQTAIRFGARSYRIAGDSARRAPAAVHTLHTALAALRAWPAGDGGAGTLYVVSGRTLYRVDVSAPVRERAYDDRPARIRIDCRAREVDLPDALTSITIYLAADADRVPIRIELEQDGERASAELVDRAVARGLLPDHYTVADRHGTSRNAPP